MFSQLTRMRFATVNLLAILIMLIVPQHAYAAGTTVPTMTFYTAEGNLITAPYGPIGRTLEFKIKLSSRFPVGSVSGYFQLFVDGVAESYSGERHASDLNLGVTGASQSMNLYRTHLSYGLHTLTVLYFDSTHSQSVSGSFDFNYNIIEKYWEKESIMTSQAIATTGSLEMSYVSPYWTSQMSGTVKCFKIRNAENSILRSKCVQGDIANVDPYVGTWAFNLKTWQIPNGTYKLSAFVCDWYDSVCQTEPESEISLEISQPGEPITGSISFATWTHDSDHANLKQLTLTTTGPINGWCFYVDGAPFNFNGSNRLRNSDPNFSGYFSVVEDGETGTFVNPLYALKDRGAINGNCIDWDSMSRTVTMDFSWLPAGTHVFSARGIPEGLYSPNPIVLSESIYVRSSNLDSLVHKDYTYAFSMENRETYTRAWLVPVLGNARVYPDKISLSIDGRLVENSSYSWWDFSISRVQSGLHNFRFDCRFDDYVETFITSQWVTGFPPEIYWSDSADAVHHIGSKTTATLELIPRDKNLPRYVYSRMKIGLGTWSSWSKRSTSTGFLKFPVNLRYKVTIQVKIPGINRGQTTFLTKEIDSSPKIEILATSKIYGTGSKYLFKVKSDPLYRGNCSWQVYEAPSSYWDNHTDRSMPIRMYGNYGSFYFKTNVDGAYRLMVNCGGSKSAWSMGARAKTIYVLPAN